MAAPAPKPTQFGHYVLDRKLADGGMAEVFLARQQGLGGFEKQIVVKRILPTLSNDNAFVEMFLNEARIAAKLSHSNVVQVMEAGEIEGRYYIAMEYIDGSDLRLFYDEADRTKRPTPPGIACRIIADLLGGLHYAHTRSDDQGRPLGIVHRDVSPQNVLVSRSGTVKIVDFGIAKATRASAQQTQAGQVKGKIAYLSPEQAMGRPLDARSDVFACGILLWELVTGARLFSRPNDMAAILAISEDPIAMPRSVRRELPEALDYLLSQALARPLAERFPSAQEMQQALEALIRSEGWPGDRRTLEKHMQSRLGSHTPQFGELAIATEPTLAADDFGGGPTMLSDSDAGLAVAPKSAPPAISSSAANTTISMGPSEVTQPPPSMSPPMPTPGRPRTPSGMRSMPPVEAPTPLTPMRARTPSGMRSMPATPGPATPQYMAQAAGYSPPPENFDGPTTPRHGGSVLRRVLVVGSAAVLVSIGTIFALDWTPTTGKPVPGNTARLIIEVSEPATIDLEGQHTRVDHPQEIDVATGKQLTLTATTVRGTGKQETRTIAVPPAVAGEQIPLKIIFPK